MEEPICVLKIELDGQNVEEIKVFENDDPNQIVEEFGMKFNLSSNAKRRLLDQINDQIQIDDSSQYWGNVKYLVINLRIKNENHILYKAQIRYFS